MTTDCKSANTSAWSQAAPGFVYPVAQLFVHLSRALQMSTMFASGDSESQSFVRSVGPGTRFLHCPYMPPGSVTINPGARSPYRTKVPRKVAPRRVLEESLGIDIFFES